MRASGMLASEELRVSGEGARRVATGLQLGVVWKGSVSSVRYRMLLVLLLPPPPLPICTPRNLRASLAGGDAADDAPFAWWGSSSSASSGNAAKDAGILKGSEKLRRWVRRFFAPVAAAAGSGTSSTSFNADADVGAERDIPRRCNRGESANALIWAVVGP